LGIELIISPHVEPFQVNDDSSNFQWWIRSAEQNETISKSDKTVIDSFFILTSGFLILE